MVFAMHLSKLVLFNVRFEVLIVVNVGCYAHTVTDKYQCFEGHMLASSGYTALKMVAGGSLEDFETC